MNDPLPKCTTDENTLLTAIERGHFRVFYLIYNRKSTDEPDNQKNSISYQQSQNLRFAQADHLPVARVTVPGLCSDGIISERHSGFKEDSVVSISAEGLVQYRIERPKFQRLIAFLSRGLFRGVIVLCWDRLSRNRGDDTVIRKLMKHGVDVRFVTTRYDKSSAGELHMDIDGMFAQHHSRVTSEKVTLTITHAREQGKCTNRAPIGYLNEGNMDWKPFDPVRAPIIRSLYELYATEQWSLADLARYANKQGLTTVPMRRKRTAEEKLAEVSDDLPNLPKVSRPVTQNHMHRILTNPFYVGLIPTGGGGHAASTSHEPLVSQHLFHRVQQLLKTRRTSIHHADKLKYPLRGLIRCDRCRRVYTPYLKKGTVYFGARCAPGCGNSCRSFNLAFIMDQVGLLLGQLHYTDAQLAELDARSHSDHVLQRAKQHEQAAQRERERRKHGEDLAYLRSNKIQLLRGGAYTPEGLAAEERRLIDKLAALTAEPISDGVRTDAVGEATQLSELLKNVVPYYLFANSDEKEQIVRIVFSELSYSGNTLGYKAKLGFEALKPRFVADCDPTGSRTPISTVRG